MVIEPGNPDFSSEISDESKLLICFSQQRQVETLGSGFAHREWEIEKFLGLDPEFLTDKDSQANLYPFYTC